MRFDPIWQKIRILAAVGALCVLCGVLSACSAFDSLFLDWSADDRYDETYAPIENMTYSTAQHYTPVESRYAYGLLSERQQRLYDLLLGQVYSISHEKGDLNKYPMMAVKVPGHYTVAEMRVTVRALTDDNPYLFWLSHTFSHLFYEDENYTKLIVYSEFSPDDLRVMIRELDAAVEAFYASVPADLDAYEREKYVHDFLLDHCEYDDEAAASDEATSKEYMAHSIYGALVNGRCVCEGYGTAMQLLLNGLGVECVTLTGRAASQSDEEEVLHLWNAVKLDGAWYHVDPTWDDQDDRMFCYDYFNIDDALLFDDHTLSKTPDELGDALIAENGTEDMNIFIPACRETAYNYYVYECPHLEDYVGREVRRALYQAALDRADSFTFYIDPDYLNYDAAVTDLFKEYPQVFFDYTGYVNEHLYDYEIDESNLRYYSDEKRRKVIVTLNYY